MFILASAMFGQQPLDQARKSPLILFGGLAGGFLELWAYPQIHLSC
jgi:hypothetical protein